MEFEPAVSPDFSLDACLRRAEACFERKIPAIASVHSINFHSSVQDFRSRTLEFMDRFLATLESTHPDLLYLHGEEIYEVVKKGSCETAQGTIGVNVTRKSFTKSPVAPVQEA